MRASAFYFLFVSFFFSSLSLAFIERPVFIVPQYDGNVSAFEVTSGEPLWNFSTGGPLLQSTAPSVSEAEISLFTTLQSDFQNEFYVNNFHNAAPFMSHDGTIFLSNKKSTLYSVDPLNGELLSPPTPETLVTEETECREALQIVRTEQTHNGSSMHVIAIANLRVFYRNCNGDEHETSNASFPLPELATTAVGDLEAFDHQGHQLWFANLGAPPTGFVYALSLHSFQIVQPRLPPTLSPSSASMSLSLSKYKGTPYESPLRLSGGPRPLALPPPATADGGRISVWDVVAICFFTTIAIWGLYPLLYLHRKDLKPTTMGVSLQLQAELQRQISELQLQQQQQKQAIEHHQQQLQQQQLSKEKGEISSRYRKDFEEKERLGEGGFGTVFRAYNKLDGVEYAVKKVCLSSSDSTQNERVLREVRHLALLDHPNIIRYYQSWMEEDEWHDSKGDSHSYENYKYTETMESETESSFDVARCDYGNSINNEVDYEGDESKLAENSSHEFSSGNIVHNAPVPIEMNFSSRSALFEFAEASPPYPQDGKSKKGKRKHQNKATDVTLERICGSTSESRGGDGTISNIDSYRPNNNNNYCHQGTLQHWLVRPDREIVPKEVVIIFHQIVKGVAYIHSNEIIHRDLKPPNILISGDGCVKIGDFGLSTGIVDGVSASPPLSVTHSHTAGVGSPLYCSPEQLNGYRYNSKIYSLGIILYEMFHIFTTQMERINQISQLRKGVINVQTKENYPQLAEFVLYLIQADPDERPLAAHIVNHPFLLDYIIPPKE